MGREGRTSCSNWWSRRGSNPRPPHCERGALPAELLPHTFRGRIIRHLRRLAKLRGMPRFLPQFCLTFSPILTADTQISLIIHAMNRRAARYLYVHSDPLQRNRAYVRSISFNSEVDLEAYSDPTVR
jgi:hypothetical protein